MTEQHMTDDEYWAEWDRVQKELSARRQPSVRRHQPKSAQRQLPPQTAQPVQSSVVDTKPIEAAPAPLPKVFDSAAIALMGLLIGIILWPIGARFTIDGIVWLCNQLLAFLHVPYMIIVPLPWAIYLVCMPIPFLCSKTEWRFPVAVVRRKIVIAPVDVIFTWVIVAGLDFLTTYFGLRNPAKDLPPMTLEIAQSLVASAIVGILLTFGPEWLLRRAWRRLRG